MAKRLAWTLGIAVLVLLLASAWTTQPTPFVRRRILRGAAPDRGRIERRVRELVGRFHPRDGGHPGNMRRAADWIADALRSAGAAVSEQEFPADDSRYVNVVGAFGPATADVVAVGAHYDVAGEMPGADDNASGVAGLLELADLLAGAKLACRVELVAFANEEAPYFATPGMGSEVYARSLVDARRRVRGMICLEMLGCFTDAPGSQSLPFGALRLFYPSTGNFIAVVGNLPGAGIVRRVKRAMRATSALPVESINAPSFVPGVDLSDHSSFWRRGLPAVMVTDTAFYRNPRYHTAQDTPVTLDYGRMAEVVAGVRSAVLDLAR